MRENNTDTEYYLYDREDRIGDYDQSGNLLISYTHGPATDEPVAMTVNGSTYFYIPDIQGSIRAIVDIDGNMMASYVYDVWGNLVSHSGVLAEKNDYLYTGREYDWETGIYYYRARSYNPELGRFLQQDPDGMVDGPNMYVYVRDDAVNKVDPWGNWGWFKVPCLKLDKEKYKNCIRKTTVGWTASVLGCIVTVVAVSILVSILLGIGFSVVSMGTAAAMSLASIGLLWLMLTICISAYLATKYLLKYAWCGIKSLYWSWC